MGKLKTAEEIASEVALLKERLPKVRNRSAFGDDHREAIKAQIEVLESRMGADAIDAAWGDEDADEYAQNVLDAARDAHDWYTGEVADSEGRPSDNWSSLLIA